MADESRKPFPQFNPFRPFVMRELTRRRLTFPTPISAPFVRMTSCMVDSEIGYAFFTLGLHGFDNLDLNIFDITYGNNRDIVGYAYDMNNRDENGHMKKMLISADQLTAEPITAAELSSLSDTAKKLITQDRSDLIQEVSTVVAKGTHPIPGITDVDITRRGLGTPQIAKVKWKCYNHAQLEFLRNHFMVTGGHVVLEWGQQFTNRQLKKVLNFGDEQGVREHLVNAVVNGRTSVIQNWIKPNDGNYDFIVGSVGNFQAYLDAKTGIYEVVTEIYSVGEQLWGLNTHMTFVNKTAEENSAESRLYTTIADFYKIGGPFDVLVNQNSTDPASVAAHYSDWTKHSRQQNASVQDLSEFSSNPEDYRFISWEFFIRKVIPNMFSLVDDPNVKNDLYSFTKFSGSNDDWIGNNVHLRSTDPDVLLIIKSDMKVTPQPFLGAGYFDDQQGGGNEFRGKLTKGVWLNTGAIRAAFVGSNTFMDGLRTLLERMNAATEQFWGLQLHWDEEINRYKIIDGKYNDPAEALAFYKFNIGGHGELMNIEFDSAFPPALISQMALFAKFKSEKPYTQKELLEKCPSIGTTSTFIFSLNWTNLRDILDRDIQTRKTEGTEVKPIKETLSSVPTDIDNPTNKSRVIAGTAGLLTAVTTGGASPVAGQPVAVPSVKQAAVGRDDTNVAGAIRNQVKPIAKDSVRSVTDSVRSTERLDGEFRPKFQQLVDHIKTTFGYTVRILETYRSQERQDWLYKQGRDGVPGPIVTKTKHSLHTLGRAADIAIISGKKNITDAFYPTLEELAPKFGLDTIGSWDTGHIQLAGPRPPAAAWDRYISKTETPEGVSLSEDGVQQAKTEQLVKEAEELARKAQGIVTRFGNEMISMIELQPSAMVAKITRHGFENESKPNGFVTGFPTTTAIGLEILGMAGISVSDGFYVAKLPFIFERHGVFQVTEIGEHIGTDGWKTKLRGYFKLMWMDGKGPRVKPIEMYTG